MLHCSAGGMCAAFARKGEFVMEVTDGFKQASITAKSYSCAALCKNWVKIQKGVVTASKQIAHYSLLGMHGAAALLRSLCCREINA